MAVKVEKAGAVVTPDVNHGDGRVSAKNNPPEKQELLHRPHAFALMHGDGGAKIAYGELHWRVDVFTLQFKDDEVEVDVAPHSSHTHSISTDIHDGHTNGDSSKATGTYSDGTSHGYAVAAEPSTGVYEHNHGGATGNESATLSHTVTVNVGGSDTITYCSGASQSAIGNITQQVPKYPTEDGTAMDAGINETKYHDLGSFGDVYLVWKVDLENVGGEVEKCWVQVGDPAGTGINAVGMGSATTGRRAAGDPKVGTGQPEGDDEGVFKIKIGTVTESNEITQLVSSDVVWSPTVMDRVKI